MRHMTSLGRLVSAREFEHRHPFYPVEKALLDWLEGLGMEGLGLPAPRRDEAFASGDPGWILGWGKP